MKKFFLYALTAVLALGASSCKDDTNMQPNNPAEDFERMPMTMFRVEENTGVSNDPYGTGLLEGTLNTAHLAWYGVKGAGGYQIRYAVQNKVSSGKEEDWANDDNILGNFIIKVDPNAADQEQYLTMDIPHLEYSTPYRFAIRVLHPDYMDDMESPKHSKWYGHGDGRQWAEYVGITTEERYLTPALINVGNISEGRDAFTVYINTNVKDAVEGAVGANAPAAQKEQAFKEFKENFELEQDGGQDSWETAHFKVTSLKVIPSADTPQATVDAQFKDYALKPDMFTDGILNVRVTGLMQNAIYLCDVYNDNNPIPVDAKYNTIRKPVYGDPGEPILIEHKVIPNDRVPGATDYQACPLDTIIGNFATDVTLAEGQTFYLEGGKAYYFFSHPGLCKGFTLETDPADVAQGKRATVYMGGIGVGLDAEGNNTASIATCNLMFGKEKSPGEADAPIEVGSVIFRNIDFDCPQATNFGHKTEGLADATGNYFANMYSTGMQVTFESFEVYNCTFQRMVRGFLRVQGVKQKVFNHIIIDGNLFYNCGYYDTNGRGYAWFAGDGNSTVSNIYRDCQFTNNTVYDSPRTAMFSDNDKNLEYDGSVQWSIKCNNNTFINYSTRSTGRNFFQTRYIPGGSHYEFKNNLIVLAAADNDTRALNQYGADIREIKGSGQFTFDVRDNYSIGCRDAHMKDDGIFNGSQLSNSKNSFGAGNWVPGMLPGGDLVVRVGSTPLKATDFFTNPNPPYTADPSNAKHTDHAAPADIMNALKVKATAAVTAHEIYQKRIGDPRWY